MATFCYKVKMCIEHHFSYIAAINLSEKLYISLYIFFKHIISDEPLCEFCWRILIIKDFCELISLINVTLEVDVPWYYT